MKAAARTVLQDWNGGKIPFYTLPPEVKGVHVSSSIVNSWGKDFDLDSLLSQESSILNNLSTDTSNHMQIVSFFFFSS
jgi:nuclear GTP-binding protein